MHLGEREKLQKLQDLMAEVVLSALNVKGLTIYPLSCCSKLAFRCLAL